MCYLPEIYNEKRSVWASIQRIDEKYDNKSGKTNKKMAKQWEVARDRISFFFFFERQIKT